MQLPKEKIKPTTKDPKSLFIYGSPKIGKSTILSKLENNLIIDLEEGSNYLEALKIKVNNLKELSEVGKQILANNRPYQYVTIDTVSKLEDLVHDRALAKYKQSTQGRTFKGSTLQELDYGLGYGLWRAEFKEWMERLQKLAPTVIFVGHVKDKIITKGNTEVSVKDINLTGQLKAIASSNVDAVGYIYLNPDNSNERIITFFTSDEITCGNRCPHLEGKEFVISEKQEDGTVQVNWNKIFID